MLVGKSSNRKIVHRKGWPNRENFVPAKYNVKNSSLANPRKVFFPPIRIKLGLMKDFMKVKKKTR